MIKKDQKYSSQTELLIFYRSFGVSSDFGSLYAPSKRFAVLCHFLNNFISNFLKQYSHRRKLSANIMNALNRLRVVQEWRAQSTGCSHHQDYMLALLIRMRIYHDCKRKHQLKMQYLLLRSREPLKFMVSARERERLEREKNSSEAKKLRNLKNL
jgi:hypothetical protein